MKKFVEDFGDYLKYSFLFSGVAKKRKNPKKSKKSKNIHLLCVFDYKGKAYLLRVNKNRCAVELVDLTGKRIFKKVQFNGRERREDAWRWRGVRISRSEGGFVLTYRISGKKGQKVCCWKSKNLLDWTERKLKKEPKEPFVLAENYRYEGNEIAYFGKGGKVFYNPIKDLKILHKERETDIRSKPCRFDEAYIYPAKSFFTGEGVFILYYGYDKNKKLGLGAALLDKDNPSRAIWKTDAPLWRSGQSKEKYYPLGIVEKDDYFQFYLKDGNQNIFAVKVPSMAWVRKLATAGEEETAKTEKRSYQFKLKKSKKNPILSPQQERRWESCGAFNPAAVHLDEKVHLIYRAVGEDGMSVLGHASSEDGYTILERSDEPVYVPSQDFEAIKGKQPSFRYPYISGGGWGGCEDPRLSMVGDKIFMTYTAFNGHQAPGVALTWIKAKDFADKKWERWEKPKLISEPHKIQKNWVVFPGKIGGKYAILHSISPNVLIDYFDSLEDEEIVIKSHHSREVPEVRWEKTLRGVGAPPLETDYGWLTFYHAMDEKHPDRYKLGAMLLDRQNPQKIIGRCHQPIMEPEEVYENDGKPGVIYVCGSIIKNGKIFVYYGGADKVACVASAPLKKIINAILNKPDKISLEKVTAFNY